MQTIHDLADEEIAALTDEQVSMFIDVECAKQGAPLLPPAPVAPEKPEAQPDKTFYKIADLIFAKSSEAAAVLEVIQKYQQYTPEYGGGGYENRIAKLGKRFESDRVESIVLFSPECYEQHRKVIEKYGADKTRYENEKKRYDDAISKRRSATTSVWDIVSRAREIQSERKQLEAGYERYIELSKGDKEIAFNFLLNSLKSAGYEHNHDEFLESFRPETTVTAA